MRSTRRKGAALYTAVMANALIVGLLGLSALTVIRIERRQNAGSLDMIEARLHANSAVDLALRRIADDPNWRTTYSSGVETSPEPLATGLPGTLSFILEDTDGDLSDGDTNLRLKGVGRVGQAVQVSGVRVQVPPPSGPNLLTNAGFESGLANWSSWNCDISAGGNARTGSQCMLQENRASNDADAKQNITATVQNGQPYYVEVWAKTVSGTETLKINVETVGSTSGEQNFQTSSVVVGTNWTKISGVITPTWSGTLSNAVWRVFSWSDGGTNAFYTDDTVMIEQPPGGIPVVVPATWRREAAP